MKLLNAIAKRMGYMSVVEFFEQLTDDEKMARRDEFAKISCKHCHLHLRRRGSAYCGRCFKK